ncbi:GntR family transcriptional regulator [Microbacterium schleiferi]|uniref:GntR family transcriptional regulator n=1 Tax=Microbacterium schleiferi TaxID=69362 RepID=UPI001D17BC41|nr:GntR family transcriptional regulator [Microbacterium schleiferi]MCC4266969.1 GntR family transcriptional regulator [Microbacterium schleiferi]
MTTYLPLPRPGGDADTMRVQHGLLRYVREAAALGAPLPGELELTARLECSRQQLRNAMAQLEAQGIVRRRQGTVTTVDPIALRLSVRLEEQFEHTELLDRLGYHAEVEVLESRTLPLGAEIGAVMERPADTTRLAVRKRWRADGAVAMIADDTVPIPDELPAEFDPVRIGAGCRLPSTGAWRPGPVLCDAGAHRPHPRLPPPRRRHGLAHAHRRSARARDDVRSR